MRRSWLQRPAGPALAVLLLTASAVVVAAPREVILVAVTPSSHRLEDALRSELVARGLRSLDLSEAMPAASTSDTTLPPLVKHVEDSLATAQGLFYQARLEEAMARLDQEARRSSEALAQAGRFDVLRSLHVWQGVCAARLGHTTEARRAFGAAIALDESPIDRYRFPPPVVASYQETAAELRGRLGVLQVQLEPASAELLVNGRVTTARALRLVRGTHWLEGRGLGLLASVRRVEVGADARTVTIRLEPASGSLLELQLADLRRDGALDARRAEVVAAIGRLRSIEQALVVRTVPVDRDRVRVVLERVRCSDGLILNARTEEADARAADGGIRRAMADLWPTAPSPRAPVPIYKRWWFWTVLGLAAAGGTAAAILATRGEDRYSIRLLPE